MRRSTVVLAGVLVASSASAHKVEPPPEMAPIAMDPQVAVNDFAFEAYRALARDGGDIAFSPASIYVTLAALHAGAAGQTAADLTAVMHLELWDPEPLDDAFAAWLERTPAIAGHVWLCKQHRLAARYRGAVSAADFSRSPGRQRKAINRWFAKRTGKQVDELVPAGRISRATALVLASAVRVRVDWAEGFDPGDTTDGEFLRDDSTWVTVPMMHRTGPARLGWSPHAQILELPFRDSTLAMMVVAPTESYLIEQLERDLSADNLASWVYSLRDAPRVEITLPRFRIDARVDLRDLLSRLGLGSLFEGMDLSRMLAEPTELALGDAFHQVVIEVGERGGTAHDAATGGETERFAAAESFLWVIRDTATGAVLHMGRVSDPR